MSDKCEAGCGPAEFYDADGVPLCRRCWDGLPVESKAQRRMSELGWSVLPTTDSAHPQAQPTGSAASGAGEDVDLCEVARELERVHVARVIGEVKAIANERTDAYWSGFSMACDEIAHRLNTTPAVSVGDDTARLDYIERTFSGMTNRERYLPVQMVWGAGANGRTLREACDKYMKRSLPTTGGDPA